MLRRNGYAQKLFVGMCQPRNFCGARRPPNPPDVLPARFDTARPSINKRHDRSHDVQLRGNFKAEKEWREAETATLQGAEPSRIVAYARQIEAAVPEYHLEVGQQNYRL